MLHTLISMHFLSQRLERGENMDDDDVFGKGSGEARDDISNLPNKVATRVNIYIYIYIYIYTLSLLVLA